MVFGTPTRHSRLSSPLRLTTRSSCFGCRPLTEPYPTAFEHALRAVNDIVLPQPLLAYKIGITRSPSHRFHQRKYGYYIAGYQKMVVVFRGAPRLAAELERRIVSKWRTKTGCQNVAPGGESAPPVGIGCFVYLVYADLSSGHSLEQLAVTHRRNPQSIALLQRAEAGVVPDMLAG